MTLIIFYEKYVLYYEDEVHYFTLFNVTIFLTLNSMYASMQETFCWHGLCLHNKQSLSCHYENMNCKRMLDAINIPFPVFRTSLVCVYHRFRNDEVNVLLFPLMQEFTPSNPGSECIY
jgi:hypothetical protein